MFLRFAELPRGLLAASLLTLSAGSIGQEAVEAVFDPTLRASGLRIDRAMLVGPMADTPRGVALDRIIVEVQRTEVPLVGSVVVLELGRMTAEGKFVRPRVTIGRQSHELRNWMGSIGLPAERCLFPNFRGRLKRNQEDGKVGAAVLVSARCSFY